MTPLHSREEVDSTSRWWLQWNRGHDAFLGAVDTPFDRLRDSSRRQARCGYMAKGSYQTISQI